MSERIWRERWGSHWRWRWVMLAMAIAVVAYGTWQKNRWQSRRLLEHQGPVAIYRVFRSNREQLVEAYDWRTGQRWMVATLALGPTDDSEQGLRALPGGEAIVWRTGSEIHFVDVRPPHSRRTYKATLAPHHRFLGISSNGRFAAFQAPAERVALANGESKLLFQNNWTSAPSSVVLLTVCDLQTGEIVSSREWQSRMTALEMFGEFESRWGVNPPKDPTEPTIGRWRLTDAGEWKLLGTGLAKPEGEAVNVAGNSGKWRLNGRSHKGEQYFNGNVVQTFPERKRIVVKAERFHNDNIFVGNPETKLAWHISRRDAPGLQITSDGQNVVVSDCRDDILIYDLASGDVIAKEASGSARRNGLLMVGIGLFILCVVLAGNAFVENVLRWGLFDALVATLLLQMVPFPILTSLQLSFSPTPNPINWFSVVPQTVLRSCVVGTAIVVGWYWAHGSGKFGTRLLVGTLWMVASQVPLPLSRWEPFPAALLPMLPFVVGGLVLSGLVAAAAVLFQLLGWSIRSPLAAPKPWRFGLVHVFILTASIGITFALLKLLGDPRQILYLFTFQFWLPATLVFGPSLVGLMFVRSRWVKAIGLIAVAGVAVAMTYYFSQGAISNTNWRERYAGEAIGFFFATATIGLPCLVLRKHGWSWVRLRPADKPEEAMA